MKRILLFSRDPGGANAIIPLVKKLQQKYQVLLYGKDYAIEKYNQNKVPYIDITEVCNVDTEEGVRFFLEKTRPDFIITGTSADDYTEKYMWKIGFELNIKSFAILDQWVNYGIRFSKYNVSEIEEYHKEKEHDYLPTKILVMDQYAKEQIKKEGVSEDRILVSGQPYFDTLSEEFSRITKADINLYRKQIGCRDRTILIVFASEPITSTYKEYDSNSLFWGYTEKTIFASFSASLNKIAKMKDLDIKVIVRPHPKEKDNINTDCNTSNVKYYIDNSSDSKLIMKSADLVCGMSSMFLFEAAACNIDIASIQIGLAKENPFILDKKGFINTILSTDELDTFFIDYFDGRKNKIKLDLIYGASANVINFMEELL